MDLSSTWSWEPICAGSQIGSLVRVRVQSGWVSDDAAYLISSSCCLSDSERKFSRYRTNGSRESTRATYASGGHSGAVALGWSIASRDSFN